MCCVPVDLHADWLWSWWGFGRFHNLLDKLTADLVTWQEDICLVPGHTALQTNQVKNGKVTALRMQKNIHWLLWFQEKLLNLNLVLNL